jgi:hypothetical protein
MNPICYFLIVSAPNTAAKPARPFRCRPHSGTPAAATYEDAGANCGRRAAVMFEPNLPANGAASA